MTKTKLKVDSKREEIETAPLIKEKYQDFAFIGLLVLFVFIFFGGAVFSGGFVVSDNLASVSFRPYVEQANKSGNFPLWLPYIFCGLPGYAALLTSGFRWWDIIPEIYTGISVFIGQIFGSDVARVLFFYCLYAVGMYIFIRTLKLHRFAAFVTSFAAVFSTTVVVWIMIGHNTKPMVFAVLPFIFILLEKLRERFSLMYAALLVVAVHLMFVAGHLQMIFYSFCAIGIYFLVEFIYRLKNKTKPLNVLRSLLLFIVATGMVYLMTADRYFSTQEYMPYSTRGSAPIVNAKNQTQDQSGGNDYNYSTMWSFSPQEIITFFVPNYYGFGKVDYKYNGREIKVHAYWGQKEFEDAAPYMGIIVLGLAIFGFVLNRKKPTVQFLAVLCLFAMLLSFGKNFSLLYDFFFYYVPNFNKFRAPSMVLAIMGFAVPILAGYGIHSIIEARKNSDQAKQKKILYFLFFSIAFFLIGIIFAGAFKSSYLSAVNQNPNMSQYPPEFPDFIYSNMISDWYFTALLSVLAWLAFYFFSKRKLSKNVVFAVITFLLLFDLWRVGWRPMEHSKKSMEKEYFAKTDVIDFLEKDKSVFRIADFAKPSPNMPAYFGLENINGYHSAKMRVFQDLLDVADQGSTSQVTNPFLWNLMNAKYLIVDKELPNSQPLFQSQQTGEFIYLNNNYLPRAFFVDSFVVAPQIDILKHLKEGDFNPRHISFLEEKPVEIIQPVSETSTALISSKRNEYLKIDVNTDASNLLFVSEIHYPVCWQAYIDGKETKTYKTNFAFRSVVVPAGRHSVEFKFVSKKFEQGKAISLPINIVLFLALIIGAVFEFRRKKKLKNG